MAARGVPVEVLSAQLGHSNLSVTREVYRHVYDAEREGLTFDPVPPQAPAPVEVRHRVKLRARPGQKTPSAAPAPEGTPETEQSEG